jgi:hypothetical protein
MSVVKLMLMIEEELNAREANTMLPRPISRSVNGVLMSEYGKEPRNPLLDRPLNPKLQMTVSTGHDLDVTVGKDFSILSVLSRLFRRRERPRPKQDHPRDFEALADGPYTACLECSIWQGVVPDVAVEVFYDREQEHTHFLSALTKYSREDRDYIAKHIGAWAHGHPIRASDRRLISKDAR